jgi:branched-chain amino acid transport system permease protein
VNTFWIYTITGLVAASVYAVSAAGLVVTYITSRVFNFAHGAVGMVVAFIYADLRVTHGWPQWPALAICLLVIAPAIGVVLDFALMRRLRNVPVAISLMVTLALYQFLTGVATFVWGTDVKSLPALFTGRFSPVSGLYMTYDELTIFIVALVVVFGLGVFLRRTRTGTTMRAVVDNRVLSEMNGVNAARVTSFSWALGSSLSALAAILIAPSITMSIQALSLLVVSTYAAAILGRLSSLPLTFLGAMLLGLSTSYLTGYLPYTNQLVQQIGPAMPFVVLFIALVILRAEPGARFEKVDFAPLGRAPSLRTTLLVGAALIAGVGAVGTGLDDFYSLIMGMAIVYGMVLLSLVLITGMSGQVSLAQFTFVGAGAVLLPHFASHMPWIAAALLCALVTGVAGALLALPTLRLRGLYFALSTLAFAVMADSIFFPNTHLISPITQAIDVPHPGIGRHILSTPRSQLILLATVLVLYMIGLLALRRSSYGRALSAMRDAPAAANTLGLSLTWMKVSVFGISAAMAGLAGCFYGGLLGQVAGSQFTYQASMAALLILAIYGLSSVSGAIIGSVFYIVIYQLLTTWIDNPTYINALQPLLVALGVLNLVAHPEGVIAQTVAQHRERVRKRNARTGKPSSNGSTVKVDAQPRVPAVSIAKAR